MQIFKSVIGYTWALITVPFVLALMVSSQSIYDNTFDKMGLKVTDRISGGKVIKILPREDYSVHQHRPVFDGLFGDRKSGFVQIDFITDSSMPASIVEDIDYDLDGTADFNFSIDTVSNNYQLIPLTERVKTLSPEGIYVLEKRRTIRVEIDK